MHPESRNPRRLRFPFTVRELAAPLTIAVVLRLLCILIIRYNQLDSGFYSRVANNILRHGVFSMSVGPPYVPTLYRPPLYMGFVALVRGMFGEAMLPLQLIQCVLGVLAVVLIAAAAARVSKRLGRWSLWVIACSPFDAVFGEALLTEVLVTFFLAAAMFAPIVLRSRWRWSACGVCLGLAALTRDVYLLLLPSLGIAAAVFLAEGSRRSERVAIGLAIIVCGMLTIAPWTIRNDVVMHQIVPISRSVFNESLFFGTWVRNGEYTRNDVLGLPREYPPYAFKLAGERELYNKWNGSADEPARDAVYRQMFLRRLREDPGGVAFTYMVRVPQIWVGTSRFDIFTFRPAALAPGTWPYFIVKAFLYSLNAAGVLLGMLGIAICLLKRDRSMMWFAVPVIYTIAVFFPLGSVEPRYSQPVYACLLVMACFALRHFRVAWRRRVLPSFT